MERNWWWSPGNNWLIDKAIDHYHAWSQTRAGIRFLNRARPKLGDTPYNFGYSQPQWMDDAREALGKDDEETFKAIKLANL